MPLLRSKPTTYEAHKVRYEDLHLEEPDLPSFIWEMSAEEKIERNPQAGELRVKTSMGWVRAELGTWILMSPLEELRVVADSEVAVDFELVR